MIRTAALVAVLFCLGGLATFRESGRSSPETGPTPAHLALTLALDQPAAHVEPRFLSVAVDTAQVVGGEFWAPAGTGAGLLHTHTTDSFDFSRPRLQNLARALGPAYLRIGGTAADRTVYRMDDASAGAPLPEGARWALTRARWDQVNAFARATDFRIVFTLNAGRSARDADGRWDPQSARPLIEYTQRQGYPVDVWELANEPNAFPLLHWSWLSADRYAGDLSRARTLLDELHAPMRLAGLATAFWPIMGEWRSFTAPVLERVGRSLDIVTWHYYPTQSDRCPIATRRAHPAELPDGRARADIERWADQVESAARANAPQAEVWLGETASAQCGGEAGFSNSYADALWWLDELGRMSRRGESVVVRQTLAGSDYGLLDEQGLEPNPSYWASWLWRTFMGDQVIAVNAAPSSAAVRAYAHCLRGDGEAARQAEAGAVALVLENLDPAQTVSVDLPKAAASGAGVLRFEGGRLDARQVRAGGDVLEANADGQPPALPQFQTLAGAKLDLAPMSVAFVVLPRAAAPACTAPMSSVAQADQATPTRTWQTSR
jgi:heparanase 1